MPRARRLSRGTLHVLWAVVQITLSALIGLTAGCLLVAGLFYFNLTPPY